MAASGPVAYVSLSSAPLLFHPVDTHHSVFFDEGNRQVFIVRDGDPEVTFTSIKDPASGNIRLGRGPVISMKFSPDQRVLAVQRTTRTVVFVNRASGLDPSEYSQSCKSKSSTHMLGFHWTQHNEMFIITNQGVELYQVNPEKRSLKLLKTVSQAINWFVFSHENDLLLLSSTPQANVLLPYQLRKGQLAKLSKFEVELPAVYNQLTPKLLERDVTIGLVYGRLYCMVVQNNPKNIDGPKAEIQLWHLTRDVASLQHVLQLDMNGRFALNVVDNLIIAHHQVSKASVLFDIHFNPRPGRPTEDRGAGAETAMLHDPVVPALSIAPSPNSGAELYAPTWIVFQPDIIIDAKMGSLWTVSVQLPPLVDLMPNKGHLIDVLLRRKGSKQLILDVFRAALEPPTMQPLQVLADLFDRINAVCVAAHIAHKSGEDYERESGLQVVEQKHLYAVFQALDDSRINYKYMVAVVVEYVRSLNAVALPVQHFLFDLAINLLVHNNRQYQLHQFLQYHVVNDSKHVACLLLALATSYPPAFQLALDMFKRLNTANEEIFDALLGKKMLLAALRFVRSLGPDALALVSARRFLDSAYSSGDHVLFFTVFKFFEQRNIQMRKSPDFAPGEDCEVFVNHYKRLFAAEETSSTA